MIAFPKTLNIPAIESFLENLLSKPDEEIAALEMPVDTQGYHFSGLSCAIQAVATWARASKSRDLIFRKSVTPQQERIETIAQRPHEFAASMLAKTISLQKEDGAENIREQTYQIAKAQVEKQHADKTGSSRGNLCWSAFVDHSSKAFDPKYYLTGSEETPAPRQMEQISAIVQRMVHKSLSLTGGAFPSDEDFRANLGRIIYELFLNTHEHGRKTSVTGPLNPGIRMILTNGLNLDLQALDGIKSKDPTLKPYLDRFLGRGRFVEINVFDSGLGYAKYWQTMHGKKIDAGISDAEEEYKIFKKCFQFRKSSTTENTKGNGLPVVLDRLTRINGFIKVRTGKLSLYRNLIDQPFRGENDSCDFYDWKQQVDASTALSSQAEVTGVAVTLLIPLDEKAANHV